MNINKNRKSSENKTLDSTYKSNSKKLDNYLLNMFSSIKNFKNYNKRRKIKNMFTSNIINYKNTKIHHHKIDIKTLKKLLKTIGELIGYNHSDLNTIYQIIQKIVCQ